MAQSPHRLLLLLIAVVAAITGIAGAQSTSDAEALMQLKKSFTNSSSLSSWLITSTDGSKSPCAAGSHEWHGVVCGGGGVVTGLRLSGLELGGTIDVDALASFPSLRSVSFAGNNFSGPLPAFHQLTALKSMFLSDNAFSGAVPDEFFANLGHLKKLWLDGNNLSGPIPASIVQATSLLELHLDRNAFTGELPPAPPPALRSFNVSQNDLEGVVPESFRKFDAGRFAGNEYLCYVPTHVKACKREAAAVSASAKRVVLAFAAVLVSAVALAILCACFCGGGGGESGGRRSVRGFGSGGGMEGLEDKPPVYMVNDCKGVFGMGDLMKAAAEVIGSGGLGSAYKAVMASGVAVVVKRARDMNGAATKEAFDAEMRRLGAIRHANLLPPLAYHYRKDEKLLVYEYIPKGSLLYVLHGDRGMDYAALDWPARLKVAAGVARGAAFLHATLIDGHEVPHGNLKSANILLAPDFEPLLVDFGYSGLVSPPHSSMLAYRAPECAAGGGRAAPTHKADVYCLGVVLLELLTGKFPSQYLHNNKGGTDIVMWATSAMADGFERDLFDPAVVTAWKFAMPDMARLMRVAVDCVEADPEKRPDMKTAAARVEEVVSTAMATVAERPTEEEAGDGDGRRASHATYVRDGSIQRVTSVGERSSRRGSSDYSYGIS